MLKFLTSIVTLGVGAILLIYGTGEAGVREVIRWTARSSVCLLCLAMAAYGARGRSWSHWTDVLRGLALSHSVHAIAVGTLAFLTGGRNLLERSAPLDVLGGALAYAFILWGALAPQSRLAPVGLFWIWSVFLVSYGTRAIEKPDAVRLRCLAPGGGHAPSALGAASVPGPPSTTCGPTARLGPPGDSPGCGRRSFE